MDAKLKEVEEEINRLEGEIAKVASKLEPLESTSFKERGVIECLK